MYVHIIYKFSFKISLDLQGRIRKPSKRKDGIDPLLPITPARPPKTIPPPPPGPLLLAALRVLRTKLQQLSYLHPVNNIMVQSQPINIHHHLLLRNEPNHH